MRTWKVLLLATLLTAAGACGRSEHLTSPEAGSAPSADVVPLPVSGGGVLQDDPPPPPADTTGRWGGGLGSGT